jgi:hypothetical protein
MPSYSVANINPGSVRSEFMLSVFNLTTEERKRRQTDDPSVPRVRFNAFYAESRHGPYLDDGRNMCVQWFLNHDDADYLLFIDSDIVFTPDQPYQLIQAMFDQGVTLATGVYYSVNVHPVISGITALVYEWGNNPHMRHLDSDEPVRDLIPKAPVHIDAYYPQDKLHPVDSAGAGFLAIHRSVLIDMRDAARVGDPTPWFAELVIDGIHMLEDHVFCLRAASLNHRPHVLPCLELGHIKPLVVRPDRNVTK